jgi:prepilin-type N-terminal cleavage/methylation domain-containing protein
MRGFTLMEIMIVIALMMILSVIGIGSFTQATVKSKDTQRKNNLAEISKALESFYTDVGRYPLSTDSEKYMHCLQKTGTVTTDFTCLSTKLYTIVDGISTTYIDVPKDPDAQRKYVYISLDGQTYELYAGIENMLDKDLLYNEDGTVIVDPWGENCGSVQCNYQVTDTGPVRNL